MPFAKIAYGNPVCLSGFFITSQRDKVLPVELFGFNTFSEEQSVILEWRIAGEINTSRYEFLLTVWVRECCWLKSSRQTEQ